MKINEWDDKWFHVKEDSFSEWCQGMHFSIAVHLTDTNFLDTLVVQIVLQMGGCTMYNIGIYMHCRLL